MTVLWILVGWLVLSVPVSFIAARFIGGRQ